MKQEEQKDEYINAFDFLNNSADIAKICYQKSSILFYMEMKIA